MERNQKQKEDDQVFQESFALLRLWYKKRKYDDALNLINDMLKHEPTNYVLLDRKGIILVKQGKYSTAHACFEAAIQLNPQYLDAWNNKAVALAESGNSKEALTVLDQAIALAIPNPTVEVKQRMAKIYMNKGNVLFTQGRVEEAITCYNNAIEHHKDYATAWTSKGFALDSMGQYEEAIKCFHSALMINKEVAKMHTNKGLEAFRQKKYTESVYHYDKALDVDPGTCEILLHKGDALLAKTRDKEAVTAYYFAFSSEVNRLLGTTNANYRKSGVERSNKAGQRADDRFQIVQRLGKGVAKVNLVKEKDDPSGTIKVLKKIEYSYLAINVNNARREALYATRFEHRNLVKTYDCWYEFSESSNGSTSPTKRRTNAKGAGSPANIAMQKFSVYILMEYCDKGDLGTPKKRDEDEIRLILEQALEALHYLHGVHKVVHRDIKPDNFFLTKNDVLKLGDYGSSVKIAQAQGLCGTPGYQAPETLDPRMKYDEKVDIFSLGICLSEFATGLPIKDLAGEHFSVMLLENNVSNTKLIECEAMAGVSPALKDLIESMTKRDPKQRPSYMEIKNHPFLTKKDYSVMLFTKIAKYLNTTSKDLMAIIEHILMKLIKTPLYPRKIRTSGLAKELESRSYGSREIKRILDALSIEEKSRVTVRKPRSKPSTLRFPLEKTESFSLILSVTHPDPGIDTLHKFVNRKRGTIHQPEQEAEMHIEFPAEVISNLLPYLSFKDMCKLGKISKALYIASIDEIVWENLFYEDLVEKTVQKVAQKDLDELTAKFEIWKTIAKEVTERYWKEAYKREFLKRAKSNINNSDKTKPGVSFVLQRKESVQLNAYQTKFLLLGSEGVGKTTLVKSFTGDTKKDNLSQATHFYGKEIKINEEMSLGVRIIDLLGSRRYDFMRRDMISQSQGFILMFDVTNKNSFDEIVDIIGELQKIKEGGPLYHCVLVGAKIDSTKEREVSFEEGSGLARTLLYPYVEISAKEGRAVDEPFLILTKNVLRVNDEPNSKSSQRKGCSIM